MKSILFATVLTFSFAALAEVQTLSGTGIDGQACQVKITREGNVLKNVELEGASKIFEIMSENGTGYGPETSIHPRGGSEVLMPKGEMLQYFEHSENLFSDGETFSFDSSDMPTTGEDSLGPIKVVAQIELSYKNGTLVSVQVVNKAKALLFPLATGRFGCKL